MDTTSIFLAFLQKATWQTLSTRLKMPNSCASVCCFVIPFASEENHSSKPQKCRGAWKQSWAMETKTHLRWTPLPSFLHSCKGNLANAEHPFWKCLIHVLPFAVPSSICKPGESFKQATEMQGRLKTVMAMETKTHLRWTPLPSFLHSCKRQLGKRQAPRFEKA